MGEKTGISWTNHTFNPWVGCQRVSPGCEHCYAEALDKRVGGAVDPADAVKKLRWGPTAPRIRTGDANWRQPLKWNRKATDAGVRARVFCASLADVFEDRPELVPWRFDLFALIRATPMLDWLLLTKRPENIRRLWPNGDPLNVPNTRVRDPAPPPCSEWWPNVWLGTTVEDQQRADERILALLEISAAVRFLSCEPLLQRVWLNLRPMGERRPGDRFKATGIDWVIAGGESGPGARPFDINWGIDLRDQCEDAGVAFWMKQVGDNPILSPGPLTFPATAHHGADPMEWPTALRVQELPIARAA